MNLPTQFNLMAHTIKVKAIPAEKWKRDDCLGLYNPATRVIEVRAQGTQMDGHVYYHEVVHCILDAMGHKLYSDEAFVDNFAGLLQQVLETSKYPAKGT